MRTAPEESPRGQRPLDGVHIEPYGNFLAGQPKIDTLEVKNGQRVVIIGDVHGCLQPLDDLLTVVNFNPGVDVLVFVGDLVNKGPDSVAVVRRAIELNAHCVMGNHEYELLKHIDAYYGGEIIDEKDPLTPLAKEIDKECYEYLVNLPHVLKFPQLEIIVVHAGVDATRPLEDQEPYHLMNMRYARPNGEPVDAEEDGLLWAKGFNAEKWATLCGSATVWSVVFGHDAYPGFQPENYALGLDTGCVKGCELTAAVFSSESSVAGILSVPGQSLPMEMGIVKRLFKSGENECGFIHSLAVRGKRYYFNLKGNPRLATAQKGDKVSFEYIDAWGAKNPVAKNGFVVPSYP